MPYSKSESKKILNNADIFQNPGDYDSHIKNLQTISNYLQNNKNKKKLPTNTLKSIFKIPKTDKRERKIIKSDLIGIHVKTILSYATQIKKTFQYRLCNSKQEWQSLSNYGWNDAIKQYEKDYPQQTLKEQQLKKIDIIPILDKLRNDYQF